MNGQIEKLTAVVSEHDHVETQRHESLRGDLGALKSQLRVLVVVGTLIAAPLIGIMLDLSLRR